MIDVDGMPPGLADDLDLVLTRYHIRPDSRADHLWRGQCDPDDSRFSRGVVESVRRAAAELRGEPEPEPWWPAPQREAAPSPGSPAAALAGMPRPSGPSVRGDRPRAILDPLVLLGRECPWRGCRACRGHSRCWARIGRHLGGRETDDAGCRECVKINLLGRTG